MDVIIFDTNMSIKENNKTKIFYKLILIFILLFGVYLRTKLYLVSDMFEDDEGRMAIGMIGKNFLQMFLPLGAFSSSPIFLFVSKIIAEISNYNEYALKFISYISSLISIFFFYKISSKYFKKKISVIISSYFFAINFLLLYFSSIFKTYSIEVLVTLLCLYYFPKLDIKNMTQKQIIILSVVITALPLISLPSLFFIGLFFIINIYQSYKEKLFYKKFLVILIPFLLVFLLYYLFNLAPTKVLQMHDYESFWHNVFSASMTINIISPIKFLFQPNKYILCILILIIYSLICVIFSKKEHTKINLYLYSILLLSILVSYYNLYPIIIGRTALYLVPILVLVIVKSIDLVDIKRPLSYIVILMFILGFYSYFQPSFLKSINDSKTTFRQFPSKTFFYEMANRFNPDTDEIIVNEASVYMYTFYAYKNGFNKKWLMPKGSSIEESENKDYFINYFNNLDSNKNYWFYLIKEYNHTPDREAAIEWLEKQNIMYYKKEGDAYLYYIKPPYIRKKL